MQNSHDSTDTTIATATANSKATRRWKGCPDGSRVVIKAGTALLTGGGDNIDIEVMAALVGQIARLHARNSDVLLVSSGAVAAGRRVLGVPAEGGNMPLKQALAAVGQGHLMHTYEQLFSWQEIPIAQGLISQRDISDRLGYINIRNALMELARRKVVPIINENDVVAIEELSGEVFGDNDRLSALVANLVDADLLIILGRVDGLFTADPNIDSNARMIPLVERVTQEEVERLGGPSLDTLGRGGMRTKLQAAQLAASSGVDVFIANGKTPNIIERIADGEHLGTFFPARRGRMESRKRWMLSGLSIKGEIGVDGGAARVLQRRHGSLLPAGIIAADGTFLRGDLVSIVNDNSVQIGMGITNYSVGEVAEIKGKHSRQIADILGVTYGDEVVHRNNMVIV
ncbi:MAG: glutamate 5-kinase [Chloroflexi bacterium]|nr:glutamate 5-kinase [Chloroflexota bacterium]